MKIIILYDFSRFTDDELVTESKRILDKMTGNVHFPDATPTPAQLKTAHDDYLTAHAASADGGRNAILVKNQRRTVLESTLRSLGLYVQANCNNDLNIALSSGFRVKKDKETYVVLDKPGNFKAEAGRMPGSIKLSIDPVKGASIYLYEWAPTPVTEQTKWEFDLGKTSFTVKDLVQGKEYAFRVAAKGAPEEKVFSDIITRFVS